MDSYPGDEYPLVMWTIHPVVVDAVLQLQPRRLVFPGLFAVIGLFLVYTGAERILTQRRALERYVPVEATVEDTDMSIRGREGPSQTYKPEITYEYEYDGESYRSKTVYPGGNYDSRDEVGVRRLVDNHNVGDTVEAFVDPDDPENSYLVEGELRTARLFVGAGILLVVVALGLVWYASTL